MQIPYKQMLSWKTANLAPTILGLWYLMLPLLATKAININLMLFGFTFLSIAIVRAKASPTVLGSIFAMLIGLAYFMGTMTTISQSVLWTLSIASFAIVCIFEFGLFKFGPSNTKAKILTVVPLAIIGFNLILAMAGYNPLLTINWSQWMISLNYVAVTVFCWVSVIDVAGWRPFHNRTTLVLNLMALLAVALSVLGMAQGSLFQWA